MAGWNWKRPVAEFVAIFAGVTLSLLADDWRDQRNERGERVSVLELLREDLTVDLNEHDFLRRRAKVNQSSTSWLLARWDANDVPVESIEIALAAFALPLVFEYRSPAFSGLKDSNRLSLISNSDLGQDLIEYFEHDQVVASNMALALSQSKARLGEALYPYVELPKYDAPERPTRMSVATSWAELTRDQVLRNRLMEVDQYAALTLEFVEAADTTARVLIERLDEELVGSQ